jgi:hypothetical protein
VRLLTRAEVLAADLGTPAFVSSVGRRGPRDRVILFSGLHWPACACAGILMD